MRTQICYELKVPGRTTDAEAVSLLENLRMRAFTLDGCHVTPMFRLSGKELLLESWHSWPSWPMLQTRHLTARPFNPEGDASCRVDVAGFMIRSNPRSHLAVIGLFRDGFSVNADDRGWFWEFCCESESILGQRPLMQLLAAAREIGFEVRISVHVDPKLSNAHTRESHQAGAVRVNEVSMLTWLPAASLEAVGIRPDRSRELERPDGSIITRQSAPAILRVEGRETIEDVIICEAGDEPVLGWHALSGLNLSLDGATGLLVDRGPIPAAAA